MWYVPYYHGAILYRAMAMHMAAHLAYTLNWPGESHFTPSQCHLIELVEDARVEQNTIHHYPGIKKLWRGFMSAATSDPAHPVERWLNQITLALLDRETVVDDEEIAAWVKRFHQTILFNRTHSAVSVQLGMELHELFAARDLLHGIDARKLPRLAYRDDGVCLWRQEGSFRA